MNKMIWKYGLLALSIFALSACSDDTSSNADGEESSSSAAPISMSSASEVSPIKMENLAANVMSDGAGGEMLKLNGSVSLDYTFRVEDREDEDIFFNIDSMSFIAGHVDNGTVYESPLQVPMSTTFPTDRVTLGTSTSEVLLNSLEGCGDFRVYVWAFASASDEGGIDVSKVPTYSAVDSIDFKKACPKEEVSSSSVEAVCTEVAANEITLSNKLGTDQFAINLVTGSAENPHVTMEIVDNMAYLQASEGVEIWEEENQDFGLLPEAPVCAEDFKTIFGTKTGRIELMGNTWLVVKTAEGSFPMMIGKVMYQDETRGSVIITYYK